MKKKLFQYGFTFLFGAILAYWVMDAEGLFILWSEKATAASILCNAFFVPGILLASFGSLLWVANTGFFDSVAYAFRAAGHLFLPFKRTERKSYYDYKMEKAEKRTPIPNFLFHVGAVYLGLSLICLAIWCILA